MSENENPKSTEPDTYSSIAQELLTLYNAFLLIISIIALGTSIIIELTYFDGTTPPPTGLKYISLKVFEIVLSTGAIATMVSIVISSVSESNHRKKLEARLDKRITRITEEVFKGVFKINLPKGLVETGVEQLFSTPIVREGAHLTYTLRDKSFTRVDDNGKEQEFEYILLQATGKFFLVNYSSQDVTLEPKVYLPNPLVPEMKKDVLFQKFIVNGIECDIEKGNKLIEYQFNQHEKGEEAGTAHYVELPFDCEVSIPPQGKVEVELQYCMAKEVEDTEIFTTAFPMNGLTIMIIPKSKHNLKIYSRPLHNGDTVRHDVTDQGDVYMWTVNGYILKEQGLSYWWKKDNSVTPRL